MEGSIVAGDLRVWLWNLLVASPLLGEVFPYLCASAAVIDIRQVIVFRASLACVQIFASHYSNSE
jgi:hypothetical protein